MKKSAIKLTVISIMMIMMVGCASNPALYRKLPNLINKVVKPGPVSLIIVFDESKRDIKGSFPANSGSVKIAVGESVVLVAIGEDENGRRMNEMNATWTCGKTGKLSATEGSSVTFTLVTEPSFYAMVTAKVGKVDGSIAIETK